MLHLQVTFATAKRILLQLAHDPRTIALMLIAPVLLMSLLFWMFSSSTKQFDAIAPALLGVFPFVIMFLITSITTLRERTGGTMERLMALPVGKGDIVIGYAISFAIFGIIQSLITSTFAIKILGMDVAGPQWFVILVAMVDTLLGVSLGLFTSAFARTEFQAVQFLPIFIFPQLLICGLFVPLKNLPDILEAIAQCLPLTYAVDALNLITEHSSVTGDMWRDIWIVCGFIIAALVLASLTLRRQTK